MNSTPNSALIPTFAALRFATGVGAWVAPDKAARLFGLGSDHQQPFITQVFGSRKLIQRIGTGSLNVSGIPVRCWRPGADYEHAQGCTTTVTESRLHHLSAGDLGRRGSRLALGRRGSRLALGRRGSRLASGRRGSRLASVGRLASVRRRGHCASGRGRGLHRRTSGRRGSGPRPSCRPTLDPTTGRGTSDNPGTVQVGPGRRQPPPNPRAPSPRSLRRSMLRHGRCFSSYVVLNSCD